MGDMADWIIQNNIDAIIEGRDEFPEDDRATCRYCGKKNLHWVLVGEKGFRLAEANGCFHVCKEYKK